MQSKNQHEGFRLLVEPLRDRLIRIVWRILRDPDEADDALQDALATVWRRWSRVHRHTNPAALVLRIAHDAAMDRLRKRNRLRRWETSATNDERESLGAAQAEVAMPEDELKRMLCAIDQLSRNQAIAILLRSLEDLSYADIGAAIGCSEATARKHAERARDRLRASLSALAPDSPVRARK